MRAAPDIDIAAPWFLKSDDGRSSIRITSGLSLAEDEDGEVILDLEQTPDSLVRFEISDDALWVEVVSPAWTLHGVGCAAGERLRLQPRMVLQLPNNSFQLSTSLTATWTNSEVIVSLVPRAGAAPTAPVPVLHDRAPPADGRSPGPVTRAAKPPQRALGTQSALRWLMPDPDTAPPPQKPAPPVIPLANEQAFRTRPLHMGGRQRRLAQRRRREQRQSLSHFAAALVGVVLMLAASIAHTPLHDAGLTSERLARASSEPAQPMLEEVEALLQDGRMNDQASLEFAVDAYRVAGLYGHHDDAQAARLEELERRLARVAAR